MSIQLGGTIKLGPSGGTLVDYSDAISQATLSLGRATVTLPPTFGNPESSPAAGAHERTLALTFYSTQAAASVLTEIRDIILTDGSLMGVDAVYNDGLVSADNERYTMTVMVTGLDIAPVTVGETRVQTQSYPLVAGTLVIAAT